MTVLNACTRSVSSASPLLRSLAAGCLLTAALASCGGDGGGGAADELASGSLLVRQRGGEWTEQSAGPLLFGEGTMLEAGAEPATIIVGAGGSKVRIELQAGARFSRRKSSAFDLWAGSFTLSSIGQVARLNIFHTDNYIDAEGLKTDEEGKSLAFDVVTSGKRMSVKQLAGRGQVNTIGKDDWELNYVTLKAGEQGLVEPGIRPTKHDLSDTKKGPLLLPGIELAMTPPDVESGVTTQATVTISAGQSGLFEGLAFEGNDADAFVLLAESGAGAQEIVVSASDVVFDAPVSTIVAKRAVNSSEPFVFTMAVGPDILGSGNWSVRVRYTSYKKRSDGAVWQGSVTSEPVEVVIP